MRRILSLSVFALWMTVSMVFAVDKPGAQKRADSDAVFGPTRIWKIHLHVTAENWKAMQPPGIRSPPMPANPPATPLEQLSGVEIFPAECHDRGL